MKGMTFIAICAAKVLTTGFSPFASAAICASSSAMPAWPAPETAW